MNRNDTERQRLREFAEFVDADRVAPSAGMDEAVLGIVAKDLRPAPWRIFAKMTLIGVATGSATLAVCPQFGLGSGSHNAFLHGIHAATSPAVFYLLCGMLFVTLGAILSGCLLTRNEINAVGKVVNQYFAAYCILAYVTLVTLGPEIFAASSLTWIVGALLSNVVCYGSVVRLRHAWGAR
ncbi:hypothetical protein DSECCO2_631820 [anaerobic digester metagenome]